MRLPDITFLLFLLAGISCNRYQEAEEFTIRGEFRNSAGEKVVFSEMGVRETLPLDSATVSAEGRIRFRAATKEPGFYLLQFPGNKRLILLLEKNDRLFIAGDLHESTEKLTLSGSKGSEMLQDFFRVTAPNKKRVDSVRQYVLYHQNSDDFLLASMHADSLFSEITADQKQLEKEFIDRNPESLASLIVLNYSFGLEPVLTPESDLPYYQKLKGLSRIYPTDKHVIYHLNRMKLYEINQRNQTRR